MHEFEQFFFPDNLVTMHLIDALIRINQNNFDEF